MSDKYTMEIRQNYDLTNLIEMPVHKTFIVIKSKHNCDYPFPCHKN